MPISHYQGGMDLPTYVTYVPLVAPQQVITQKALAFMLTQPWRDCLCPFGCTPAHTRDNKNPALAFALALCFGTDNYFHPMNVSVHGIDETMVSSTPSWSEVYSQILPFVTGQIVASHMPFDRTATLRACQNAGLAHFDCSWLDTAKVARRAWIEFSPSGYGLKNLASTFEIPFEHHDALEDARAAGEILLRAIAHAGSTAAEWCSLVNMPLSALNPAAELIVNQDGVLVGNIVVFTGALSIPRQDASAMAAAGGCDVGSGVTKQTTLRIR